MNYTIKNLQHNDITLFWSVFASVLKSQFPGYTLAVVTYLLEKVYNSYSFNYWIEHNEKTVLIASIDNTIVGFAVIDRPYGGVSFCRWLGVLPEHQHKGIGRELINSWLTLAQKQGCHKIEVASQPEAREFYRKVGLILEGKREKSYFGIDHYIFGKVIGEARNEVMTK